MLQSHAVELPHQTLERKYISVQVSGEQNHTVDDLRDQCHGKDHNEENDRQNCKNDRERVPQLSLLYLV